MNRKNKARLLSSAVSRLERVYRSPRLGNKKNPLDELYFILLSLKTPAWNFEEMYVRLRNAYRPWSRLLMAKETELDALSSALIQQDVSGALNLILPEARRRHEGLLQAIKGSLPALHASLPAPELARVDDDTAEYFIVRQQNLRGVMEEITHSIWFQRDSDGIWRIRDY